MSSHFGPATTAKLFALALMCLVAGGCGSALQSEDKILVTTSTGRKEIATRRYTLDEIEAGARAGSTAKNPFDMRHPVYPSLEQIGRMKQQLQSGGEVWYFQGLDSGWAIIKDREVWWVLVTHHEY